MLAYLCTQFGAIVHYLRLCFWPRPLVLDYGRHTVRDAWAIVPCGVVVGLLGVATVVAVWRWPKVGFLGAWFLAILAPTSSVVPVATQTMAEHRMYLPLAAVVAGVVVGGYLAGRWLVGRGVLPLRVLRAAGGFAVLSACVLLGLLTYSRNLDYQSDLSIWQDTADKVPNNERAHNNLGLALADRGQIDEAIAHYQKALEIKPDYAEAHNNLGLALAGRGRIDEAIAHYQKALEIKPDHAEAHNNLGIALAGCGRIDEAIVAFPEGPGDQARLRRGPQQPRHCLGRRGRIDEAIAHFQKALEIRPDYAEAHANLGAALAGRGRMDEAIEHWRKALVLAEQQNKAALVEGVEGPAAAL